MVAIICRIVECIALSDSAEENMYRPLLFRRQLTFLLRHKGGSFFVFLRSNSYVSLHLEQEQKLEMQYCL